MRSWCFDSVATEVDGVTTYDREYGSAEFREVISKLVGNGVYANPASNMQVVVTGGLNVAVQPGCCWIQGAFGVVDEAETLTIEPSTNGRYDAIVARFDLSLASRDIHLAVIKGTEGSLMRPTLTRNASIYELQLASIHVNANATAISTTDITDTRYSSSYCGVVAGVIDQINTTGLFIQYEAQFYKFLNEIKDSLTGDVAGNLLTLIDNHTKNLNNPHNVTKDQVGLGNVLNEKQYCASNPPTTAVGDVSLSWDMNEDIMEETAFDHIKGFWVTAVSRNGSLKDSFFVPFGTEIIGNNIQAGYNEYSMGSTMVRHLYFTNYESDTLTVFYVGIS